MPYNIFRLSRKANAVSAPVQNTQIAEPVGLFALMRIFAEPEHSTNSSKPTIRSSHSVPGIGNLQ